MVRSFDELVDEAGSVSADGWDFSWLDGPGRWFFLRRDLRNP